VISVAGGRVKLGNVVLFRRYFRRRGFDVFHVILWRQRKSHDGFPDFRVFRDLGGAD
jgi:hypothetical protein